MLEEIIFDGDKHINRWHVFIGTVVYSIIGILVSYQFIQMQVGAGNLGGFIAVIMASLGLTYPLTEYIRKREHQELKEIWSEDQLIARHADELETYITCFLGIVLVFGIATVLVPLGPTIDAGDFFHVQGFVLEQITNGTLSTGQMTAHVAATATQFLNILTNNIGVLALFFLVGLTIPGGIIFLMAWNASLLGVLVGHLSESIISVPLNTLPYLVHGTLEIAAYGAAGIAGTLLAYHLEHRYMHGTHTDKTFQQVTEDSLVLLVISLGTVLIAAVVETGYPFV